MKETAIASAIKKAYENGKLLKTQGERIFIEGSWGNFKIQMWVNTATKIIESAWPKY